MSKTRFTTVMQTHNTGINSVSHTHNCKPTSAIPCIIPFLFYLREKERGRGWWRERKEGREGGGERKGNRNINLLFHLFIHSVVTSCRCPAWVSNSQPWRISTTLWLAELPDPGCVMHFKCSVLLQLKPIDFSANTVIYFCMVYKNVHNLYKMSNMHIKVFFHVYHQMCSLFWLKIRSFPFIWHTSILQYNYWVMRKLKEYSDTSVNYFEIHENKKFSRDLFFPPTLPE